MKKRIAILLLVSGFVFVSFVSDTSFDNAKASFIINFLRYVQWPDTESNQDFLIGIYGDHNLMHPLKVLADGKTFGMRTAKVIKVESQDDILKCKILFLPEGEVGRVNKLLKTNMSVSVLVITEEQEYNPRTSVVNFKVINNRLAFSINSKAADARQLQISSKLVSMAVD